MKQLTLSQSIAGFLLERETAPSIKQAQHLSPHTVADYTNAFRKLQAYLVADVPFAGITADQVLAQHVSGPDAKLCAPVRIHPVADGEEDAPGDAFALL